MVMPLSKMLPAAVPLTFVSEMPDPVVLLIVPEVTLNAPDTRVEVDAVGAAACGNVAEADREDCAAADIDGIAGGGSDISAGDRERCGRSSHREADARRGIDIQRGEADRGGDIGDFHAIAAGAAGARQAGEIDGRGIAFKMMPLVALLEKKFAMVFVPALSRSSRPVVPSVTVALFTANVPEL